MHESKPTAAAVHSSDAKQLFMECLQASDESSREQLLSAADPKLAEEVRGLLGDMDHGGLIDQVFGMTGDPSLVDPKVTVDSNGDQAENTGDDRSRGDAARPGRQIDRYKLLEQIGEGGMGTVFMAQQTEPVRRRVALKIIKAGMDSRQVIARFEAERQALAMMDHPNIARVFDGGTTEQGRPYFVMELVKGIPLTEFCRIKKFTLRERLKLFIDVCRGVQHAHQRGIIHRDLKPSNVMVTLHDGKPVVKIIDFGIAKATNQELTDKTLFTQFAAMIGTPLYMSPEQAELSGLDVDTRSDIYSLGVMLYELLTNTTPFAQETLKQKGLDEVRRIIRETDPPKPSQRISTVRASEVETSDADRLREIRRSRSELSGELDWVAMKAIEKDRERRYLSASDLADDIQRYLDGEAVEACPPSVGYRLRKYTRRHRVMLATSSLVLMAVLAGTVASLRYAIRADTEASNARAAETRASQEADRARDFAHQRDAAANELAQQVERVTLAEREQAAQRAIADQALYESEIVGAAANVERGEDAEALTRLLRYVPWPGQPDRRGWEWYYLLGQLRLAKQGWMAHRQYGDTITWHPGGEFIVTTGRDRRNEPIAKIWKTSDLENVETLEGWMAEPQWGPNGRYLATGQPHDTVHTRSRLRGAVLVRDIQKQRNEVLFTSTADVYVDAVAWNHHGDRISGKTNGQKIEIWRDTEGQWKSELVRDGRLNFGWSDSDEYFAYFHEQSIHVIDGRDFEPVKMIPLEDEMPYSGYPLPWHPNLPLVPCPTAETDVVIVDVEQEATIARLSGDKSHPRRCVWSPDGSLLAIARQSGRIEVWSTVDWQIMEEISAHDSVVTGLCWSPESNLLASIGGNGDCFLWELEGPKRDVQFETTNNESQSFFTWLDRDRILFVGTDGKLQIGNMDGSVDPSSVSVPEKPSRWRVVGPTTAVSISGSDETTKLNVVDLGTGRIHVFDIDSANVSDLRFSHHSAQTRLAVSHYLPSLRSDWLATPQVIDLATGTASSLSVSALAHVTDMEFSPDGRLLASAGGGAEGKYIPTLNLFDAETGSWRDSLLIGNMLFGTLTTATSWRPGAQQIVVGVADGVCQIVDVAMKVARLNVRHHAGPVTALAWHPSEDLIASGGADGDVCVWHSKSGTVLLRFRGSEAIARLKWGPDGVSLAAQDRSGRLKVWNASRGVALKDADVITMKRGYSIGREAENVLELARAYRRHDEVDRAVGIIHDFLRRFEIDPDTGVKVWESSEMLQWIPKEIFSAYHHYRGQQLSDQDEREKSAREFVTAHEFAPTDRQPVIAMAGLRRAGIAIPEFEPAVDDVRAHAQWFLDRDDKLIEKAIEDEARSIAIQAKATTLGILADFLDECEIHFDEAVALREELVELRPDDARSMIKLADAYWEVGRQKDAIEAARRAAEMEPDNQEYASRLREFDAAVHDSP